jgi:Concanavalin A-like lectin/glucanases superfamily/PEP-CTERM motif
MNRKTMCVSRSVRRVPAALRSRSRRFTIALLAAVGSFVSAAETVRAGLVSEWRFNETSGSIAHDNIGGINGVLSGGATFDPGAGPGHGLYSGAISFSALSDSFVDMGKVYPFTSGDFSIVMWIRTSQANAPPAINNGQIALSEHHTGFANGYFFALNNVSDGLATVGSHFYATSSAVGSTGNVNDGNWHQLAAVYHSGGTSMSWYVDGNLKQTGPGNAIASNDAPFMVGGVDNVGTLEGTYTGLISDVRVYNNALSSSDVHATYETVLMSVPEPSSFILLAMGGLATTCYLWRRKGESRHPKKGESRHPRKESRHP